MYKYAEKLHKYALYKYAETWIVIHFRIFWKLRKFRFELSEYSVIVTIINLEWLQNCNEYNYRIFWKIRKFRKFWKIWQFQAYIERLKVGRLAFESNAFESGFESSQSPAPSSVSTLGLKVGAEFTGIKKRASHLSRFYNQNLTEELNYMLKVY